MKKIINLILSFTFAALCMVSVSSCSSSDSLAQEFVDQINSQKSALSQPGVSIDGAKIEGKQIVITISMEIEFGEMISKEAFVASCKSQLNASSLVSQFGVVDKAVIKSIADGGYSIVYRYLDSKGESAEIEITNSDLKAAL